jgi:NADH-quinone oxidoreductase subunit G
MVLWLATKAAHSVSSKCYDASYYKPEQQIKEGWRWLHAIHTGTTQSEISWTQLDEVIDTVVAAYPVLSCH